MPRRDDVPHAGRLDGVLGRQRAYSWVGGAKGGAHAAVGSTGEATNGAVIGPDHQAETARRLRPACRARNVGYPAVRAWQRLLDISDADGPAFGLGRADGRFPCRIHGLCLWRACGSAGRRTRAPRHIAVDANIRQCGGFGRRRQVPRGSPGHEFGRPRSGRPAGARLHRFRSSGVRTWWNLPVLP